MMSREVRFVMLTVWVLLVLLPGRLLAQSAIGGVVKDTTGAVMPGVTVEASSPALIEKVRSVVSDASGQYLITDLRPGLYSVTFLLEGFSGVKREGFQLATNFTATINAEMRVGALEETVTVTGEAPTVDMRSATQQQVLSKELLESVPTGRNIQGVGATLPGVTLTSPDVGGSGGMQQVYMAVHGSLTRDNTVQVDGMTLNGIEGDGAIQQYFNQGMVEEQSYQTSALPAEIQGAGVRVNMIPKDGGNTVKGSVFWSETPGAWQSNNFTQEIKDTGMRAPNRVKRIFDLNFGVGGPIKTNRLWFYSSYRRWGVNQTVSESFYNADPTHRTPVADVSRPTVDDNLIHSGMTRLTFQASSKHKFAAYAEKLIKFRGHECGALSFEEACGIRWPKQYLMAQAKYTGALSNRLLVETGWAQNNESYNSNAAQESVLSTDVGRVDRTTGESWSAPNGPYYFRAPIRYTVMGVVSYVTGSHALKAGFQWGYGGNRHERSFNGGLDLYQEYRTTVAANGTKIQTPASVVVYNTPQWAAERIKYDLGLYVQDSWKFSRMTLNPGLRIDLFNTFVPAYGSPAGRFVPAREFALIENSPSWKDVSPRIGMVYDLLGDGKTAVKVHVGRYVTSYSTVGFAAVYNPMAIQSDRRTWTDRNGDDIAQDSEIGPVQTPFNISGPSNRQPDPSITRPYQWEYNVGFQHELAANLSISGTWVRRDFRNNIWTDNVLTTFDDYTIVNIPNPVNTSQTIPVYNLNVAKRGVVKQIDFNSDKNWRTYNGFDVGFTTRIGGANMYGGVSTGRNIENRCEADDPNALRFCDQSKLSIPYLTQMKLAGSYPLPLGIKFSGTWQSYPGLPGTTGSTAIVDSSMNVDYIVDRTIIPNLTQASVTVQAIEPGTKYLDRWNQFDIRLGKTFEFGRARVQAQFDVFNLMNTSSIINVTQTYGPSLDRPTRIIQGRLMALGAQLTF